MQVDDHQLLVTTAIEEAWGSSEKILFLGEWCKRYERRDVWAQRNHETIKFHWDDREKLRQDYHYLASLHQSVLGSLARALNDFHEVDCSLRYWQTQLDPWLMAYLGVMFDRWECLRLAFEAHNNLAVIFLGDCEALDAPFSYAEFVQLSAYSDAWNQSIYQRIINSEYLSGCSVDLRQTFVRQGVAAKTACLTQRQILLQKMASFKARYLRKTSKSQDFVFIGAIFSRYALAQINSALGQAPQHSDVLDSFRPVRSASTTAAVPVEFSKRADICIDFQPESRFEAFVKSQIVNDLPRCLVESYFVLLDRVRDISIRPKVIVTGSSHWGDAFAKMWFAERGVAGTKIIIQEHGGSLPPFKELFDFESDISDVRTSWFLPYHAKHVRMPPPKIVGRDEGLRSIFSGLFTQRKYCSLIGNECARWVHRVHFYPMAYQWSTSFEMILAMYGGLDEVVKDSFRIKPYPSQGWNTAQRYSDAMGCDKIFKGKSLARVYAMSRVIVCSYPETTFSEAMASGVPTVLLYPDHLYELNPIALPLLETLRAARIVFHDPLAAAEHLNAIWADPNAWWSSSVTVFARNEFYRQALDMDPEWLNKWVGFLKDVVSDKMELAGSAQQAGGLPRVSV